jgi:hypothetical protein
MTKQERETFLADLHVGIISIRITHLAFYAGWPNAMTATVAREVFESF